MQKSNTLVEVGHIYLDEILSSYHEKPINIYKDSYKNCDAILMIDDLNISKENITVKEIRSFYEDLGCSLLEINNEKKMTEYTQKVLPLFKDSLRKEYFRKEKKNVYFFDKNGYKVALYSVDKSDNVNYTCSLLSLCWLLYKANYFGDFKYYDHFVVIIPEKYRRVEDNVQDLLFFLNINISVENHFF